VSPSTPTTRPRCSTPWLPRRLSALATVDQPTLLVAATDSRPELRKPTEAMAEALPNARMALVGGGHLINPAAPEVVAFIDEVLASR
jgi:pimeloyl-ACP methyl ester carboxylesterase